MHDIWRPIYTMCQLHLFSSSWCFPLYFLVIHPDCKDQGCCWFPPVLFQTEALAAFGLSPLLWAEVKQPKIKHSFAYFILSTLRPAPPDSCKIEHMEALQKHLVLWQFLFWRLACGMHTVAIPSAGGDPLRARFPSCIAKYGLLQNTCFCLRHS